MALQQYMDLRTGNATGNNNSTLSYIILHRCSAFLLTLYRQKVRFKAQLSRQTCWKISRNARKVRACRGVRPVLQPTQHGQMLIPENCFLMGHVLRVISPKIFQNISKKNKHIYIYIYIYTYMTALPETNYFTSSYPHHDIYTFC